MRKPFKTLIALTLAGILSLTGCTAPTYDSSGANNQPHDLSGILNQAEEGLNEYKNSLENNEDSNSQNTINGTVPDWNITDYPDYYLVAGKADFTNVSIPTTPSVINSQLDQYGRAGQAVALINKQMRDAGSDRDRDMPDEIAGWPSPNPKVTIDLGNGRQYRGYLFNRSHLIAKSLGGEDSVENMVTGTRTQNVGKNQPAGGMAYTETEARDWLDQNPSGTITYAATPVYEGSELLPRYVTVDIKTSDGTIDQHVIVWNTANGFDIDYQNGGVR